MESSLQQLINLSGKTAVVTGAAVGIGLAIAERLHEAGANVCMIDIDEPKLHEAADRLSARRPDSVYVYKADVADEAAVQASIDKANEHFGGVDILVNNAGIYPMQPLASMTADDFMRVMSVNTLSVFLFCKRVAADMIAAGKPGRIINITSIDAVHPSMVGLAHYDASKHAVWGFTKNIARELSEYNITVNALAPGGIATPGVAAMSPSQPGVDPAIIKQAQAQFLAKIPMHRMGDPDEIARVALFMASDLSSYMTGSQVIVDGGALLA